MINKKIVIFTDGSCTNNGCPDSEGGIGILFPNDEFNNVSEKFILNPITNQRAELYAILKAIKIVSNKKRWYDIEIYSDSIYTINCCTKWLPTWIENGWKKSNKKSVLNQDILSEIDIVMKKHRGYITFKHVKAHAKDQSYETINNNKVDLLAKNCYK